MDFTEFTTGKGLEWKAKYEAFLAALTAWTDAFEGSSTVTSTDTVAIGTGTKSFSVTPDSPFSVGNTVRAWVAGDTSKFMVGQVTVSSGGSLSFNATIANGAGSASSWIVGSPLNFGFLPSSGGSLSGALEILAALTVSGGDIVRSGAAGTERGICFKTDGGLRVALVLTGDAEGGSNAGSNLEVRVYADDGTTLLATPLTIHRATGLVTLGGDLGMGGKKLNEADLRGTRMGVSDLGGVSGTVEISLAGANVIHATIIGETTFNFAAAPEGAEYSRKFKLTMGGAGGFNVLWTLGGTSEALVREEPVTYTALAADRVIKVVAEIDDELEITEHVRAV